MEAPEQQPSIEAVHRDLALANSYRQEFIKSLIFVAGALFAFSVSFRPQLVSPTNIGLFWVAWAGLAISMVGGFGQLACWERIYASYQRYEWKNASGDSYRHLISLCRRVALVSQVIAFIVGVTALGAFTALNLDRSNTPNRTAAIESGQ